MTRRKIIVATVVAAVAAFLAWPESERLSSITKVSRNGTLVFPRFERVPPRPVPKRTRVAPHTSARVEAWLAEHPPSPALREALLDIAARSAELEQPLPTAAPEDDAAAAAREAARERRTQQLEEFRALLRATLRTMTAGERAALRSANVHIIQLARHVAERS